MQTHSYLTREAHLIALTRALRALSDPDLGDDLARARAYATAGITAWLSADDVEALRRTRTYWKRIAPAAAAAMQAFADAKIQPAAVLA